MAFLSGGVQLDLVADFGFDLAAFDYDAMVYSFILYFPTCKIVLKHFWLDQIHLLLFGYIAHYEVVVSGVSIKGQHQNERQRCTLKWESCCLLCLFKLIENVFLQLVEFETQATAGVITWDVSAVLGYPGETWMVLSDAWSFMWPGFFQEADTQLVLETAQAYWQSYDGGGQLFAHYIQ